MGAFVSGGSGQTRRSRLDRTCISRGAPVAQTTFDEINLGRIRVVVRVSEVFVPGAIASEYVSGLDILEGKPLAKFGDPPFSMVVRHASLRHDSPFRAEYSSEDNKVAVDPQPSLPLIRDESGDFVADESDGEDAPLVPPSATKGRLESDDISIPSTFSQARARVTAPVLAAEIPAIPRLPRPGSIEVHSAVSSATEGASILSNTSTSQSRNLHLQYPQI